MAAHQISQFTTTKRDRGGADRVVWVAAIDYHDGANIKASLLRAKQSRCERHFRDASGHDHVPIS